MVGPTVRNFLDPYPTTPRGPSEVDQKGEGLSRRSHSKRPLHDGIVMSGRRARRRRSRRFSGSGHSAIISKSSRDRSCKRTISRSRSRRRRRRRRRQGVGGEHHFRTHRCLRGLRSDRHRRSTASTTRTSHRVVTTHLYRSILRDGRGMFQAMTDRRCSSRTK